MSQEHEHLPPSPPEIKRRVQFHRLQMVGVPLLMLISILALAGVFGEDSYSVNDSNSQLLIEVEYPTRFRYKMINPIRVSVKNVSTQPLATVQVNFDRAYIDSFSGVSFTPDVALITDAVYVLELTDLQPQETQMLTVEIQANKYWRQRGAVTAVPENDESVTVSLDTFVFP
jgi:hypothetical protein